MDGPSASICSVLPCASGDNDGSVVVAVHQLDSCGCESVREGEGSGGAAQSLEEDPYGAFCGSWADEVEREELLLGCSLSDDSRFAASKVEGCLPRTRHQQQFRRSITTKSKKKTTKKKIKKKKKPVKGFKLFFGGIIFADLEEGLFEMEEAIGEDVEPEVLFAAHDTLKKLRIDCLESMFNEFGEVVSIKPSWEKRFCHVVYRHFGDALRATQVLARADERKKRQDEFGDALEAAGFPRFAAPRPNFYVRWPRDCPSQSSQSTDDSDLKTPIPQLCRNPKRDCASEEGQCILYWLTTTPADARWDLLNDAKPTTAVVSNENGPARKRKEVIGFATRKDDAMLSHGSSSASASPSTAAAVLLLPLSLAA